MKRIAIVTSNRADYGILSPLIRRINADSDLELRLLVTGAHLSHETGYTISQIEEDGLPIAACIPIFEEGDAAINISNTIANAISGFAAYFQKEKPDLLILLGDRTEILGVAIAAMNERIPIAHIHGGECTEGAVDDCVRHALTKMSYLHFAGTDEYRKRIIQLGENPSRVFNVGTLSAENILNLELWDEQTVRDALAISPAMDFAIVTLHPETLADSSPRETALILCECMEKHRETFFIITGSNSDAGGSMINATLQRFSETNDHSVFIHSLGLIRYLSAARHAKYVMGNSSSGVVEIPILGTPTINIGTRQSGRIMPPTVINVPFNKDRILSAMENVSCKEKQPSSIFGDGHTSEKIVAIIKDFLQDEIDLQKGFYDLPMN